MKKIILFAMLMGLLSAVCFAQRGSHASAPNVEPMGPGVRTMGSNPTIAPDARTITPNAGVHHVAPNAVSNSTKTLGPNARTAAGAKTTAPDARTAPDANTLAPDNGVRRPDAELN